MIEIFETIEKKEVELYEIKNISLFLLGYEQS